jgi:hypothetical protein
VFLPASIHAPSRLWVDENETGIFEGVVYAALTIIAPPAVPAYYQSGAKSGSMRRPHEARSISIRAPLPSYFAIVPEGSCGLLSRSGPMGALQKLHAWAACALWALGAFCVAWIVTHIPEITAAQRALEIDLQQHAARKDSAYCVKWGFAHGTHAHVSCMLDLQELRADERDRMAGENPFGF